MSSTQNKRIYENVSKIKYVIMVLSGKGGVGKTTFSVNFAASLYKKGFKVGILDIDIHGANVPKMMGIDDKIFDKNDSELIYPVKYKEGFKVTSIALTGMNPEDAVIWRSPVKTGIIRQFLSEVIWDELDFLIIDTPAGTGDEALTLVQTIPLAGSIIVSSPQEVALLDAKKSISFSRSLFVPILGIVENMSGFICPECGKITELYKSGGSRKLALEKEINFLGSIPMDVNLIQSCDSGKVFYLEGNEGYVLNAFTEIRENLLKEIERRESLGLYEDMKKEVLQKIEEFSKKDNNDENFTPVRLQ